jgi:hypothetical protein
MDPRLSFPVSHPAFTAQYISPQSTANSFNALLDSGCTRHVVRNRALFRDYAENSFSVHTATCGSLEALGSGDVEFRYPFGDKNVIFTLRGCLYAPTAPINLLSVGTLVERGLSCLLSPDGVTEVSYPDHDPKLPGLTFSATVINHLSFLLLDFIPPVTVLSSVPTPVAFPARVSPLAAVPPSPSQLASVTVSLPSSSSRSSSRHKPSSLPKTKPISEHPHYLVVEATLPSHVFGDRSLFTTYVPSRKIHRTAFGTDIIIEGVGDVHLRVFAGGKSILFRFRDSWHVPTSPHHFLSCSTIISLGHQVMMADRSPRMIFSHNRRLVEPNLPKYLPFTRVDGLIILKFDIPVLSPQAASPTTQSTASSQSVFSLQASCHSRPFAGLVFDRSLPIPVPLEAPMTPSRLPVSESPKDDIATADAHKSAEITSHTSLGDGLHDDGGADGLVGDDYLGQKDHVVIFTSHGGGDDQIMQMNVTTDISNGDAEDQATDAYGGDPNNQFKSTSSKSSLDSRLFNLRPSTPSAEVLRITGDSTCFSFSLLFFPYNFSSFYSSVPFSPFLLSSSFSIFVQQLLATSPQMSFLLIPPFSPLLNSSPPVFPFPLLATQGCPKPLALFSPHYGPSTSACPIPVFTFDRFLGHPSPSQPEQQRLSSEDEYNTRRFSSVMSRVKDLRGVVLLIFNLFLGHWEYRNRETCLLLARSRSLLSKIRVTTAGVTLRRLCVFLSSTHLGSYNLKRMLRLMAWVEMASAEHVKLWDIANCHPSESLPLPPSLFHFPTSTNPSSGRQHFISRVFTPSLLSKISIKSTTASLHILNVNIQYYWSPLCLFLAPYLFLYLLFFPSFILVLWNLFLSLSLFNFSAFKFTIRFLFLCCLIYFTLLFLRHWHPHPRSMSTRSLFYFIFRFIFNCFWIGFTAAMDLRSTPGTRFDDDYDIYYITITFYTPSPAMASTTAIP